MRPNVLIQRLPSLVALVALASATGCADERSGPATGSLDGKCYPNGTCNPGLACQSVDTTNICVEAEAVGSLGGMCYNNGTCNPGLVCDGTVCAADTSEDRGSLGGACYGNGSCNPDLTCNGTICEVNNTPHSGLLGGACYDNGTCNPGLACDGALCIADATIPSGTIGGACLVNGTCGSGLICSGIVCEVDDTLTVGTVGAACFPNGTCNGGLECVVTVDAGESSAECAVEEPIVFGIEDGPCFVNGTCNGGLVCDLGTCVPSGTEVTEPPGSIGGLCFSNGTCDDGNVCNSFGKCEAIVAGGLFGACLPTGACNLGLSCQVGPSGGPQCLPIVEHLASIHGVVTDYTTNARLANVQVTLVHLGGVEQTVTDALGYYDFDNLLPGQFEITFLSVAGTHTTRRIGKEPGIEIRCDLDADYRGAESEQDQDCNRVFDIELFPFTATETGTIWYVNDGEVVPAAGVTVIADFGASGSIASGADQDTMIDISPDRFTTTTGVDGKFTFTNLPNTGDMGVRIFVAPSTFNGVDYESRYYWANLDIFDFDKVEIVLIPSTNPPILVANNFEDFLFGGFDITSPVVVTFSRTMKIPGCDIGLNFLDADSNDTGTEMDIGDKVLGELVWSNGDKTATFTPFAPLDTDTAYHVRIMGCESAIDDQLFLQPCDPGANAQTDSDCFSFTTEEGINFVVSNADLDEDGLGCNDAQPPVCNEGKGNGEFVATDNISLVFDEEVDLTVAGTMLDLVRVIDEYPGTTDPDDAGDTELEVAIASTSSSAGNVVTVDPTATLVADAHYRLNFKVFSTIVGDFDEGVINFRVTPEGNLEFLFANIPVVGEGSLEVLDPAANIVLTFSKDVNLALSTVTIENDDANETDFGFILDAVNTATGATITINPAANLTAGDSYTVRYSVFPTDGQGSSVGRFTFKVQTTPTTIAFVESNLSPALTVNWERDIFLHFSTAVDKSDTNEPDDRNVIQLTDADGNVYFPDYTVSDIPAGANPKCVDCRVTIKYNDIDSAEGGRLVPDTSYTLAFKIYAATVDPQDTSLIGTFVQVNSLPFTTDGHIVLLSTTVGTYTDKNDDGFFTKDDFVGAGTGTPASAGFAVNGVISVTFTEALDLTKFYPNQFVRLYRDQNNNGFDVTDDLVATVNTVAGALVTLAPLVPLDQSLAGVRYCIRAHVTSALLRVANPTIPATPDTIDESEVTELCFVTTTPAPIAPSVPTTAPTAFVVQPTFLVEHNTLVVPLQWQRVTTGVQGTTGAVMRYEIFAKDEDAPNQDFLLVKTVTDNPLVPLQTTDWTVCSGQFGPIFCEFPSDPFSGMNTATLRIRACNDAGCGPFNGTPLLVEDKNPPEIDVDGDIAGIDDVFQTASADNTGNTTARSFNIVVPVDERSDSGVVSFSFPTTPAAAAKKAQLTCAPLTTPTTDYNGNGWNILPTPVNRTWTLACTCALAPVSPGPVGVDCSSNFGGTDLAVTIIVTDENGNPSVPQAYVLDPNLPN